MCVLMCERVFGKSSLTCLKFDRIIFVRQTNYRHNTHSVDTTRHAPTLGMFTCVACHDARGRSLPGVSPRVMTGVSPNVMTGVCPRASSDSSAIKLTIVRHGRFGLKVGKIRIKCDKSGAFSVHFGSPSQNVLKSDLKNVQILPI